VNRSTVVVTPTIDLLHQWYARLVNAFASEVGVYYSGEKKVLPLTVTTYHSAGDLMAEYGNAFKLIIFDEVHHLPAPNWGYATGFWHPDYLRRKVEKVRAANCRHLLLLVYEGVNLSREALQDVPGEVLYFKQKPVLKEVMATVEKMAERL